MKGPKITVSDRYSSRFVWEFAQEVAEDALPAELRGTDRVLRVEIDGEWMFEALTAQILLSKKVQKFLRRKAEGG